MNLTQTQIHNYPPPLKLYWLSLLFDTFLAIWESPPQFENQIMGPVYVRSITRRTMYQKAPFC